MLKFGKKKIVLHTALYAIFWAHAVQDSVHGRRCICLPMAYAQVSCGRGRFQGMRISFVFTPW